jgi:hypothetical protein
MTVSQIVYYKPRLPKELALMTAFHDGAPFPPVSKQLNSGIIASSMKQDQDEGNKRDTKLEVENWEHIK